MVAVKNMAAFPTFHRMAFHLMVCIGKRVSITSKRKNLLAHRI